MLDAGFWMLVSEAGWAVADCGPCAWRECADESGSFLLQTGTFNDVVDLGVDLVHCASQRMRHSTSLSTSGYRHWARRSTASFKR